MAEELCTAISSALKALRIAEQDGEESKLQLWTNEGRTASQLPGHVVLVWIAGDGKAYIVFQWKPSGDLTELHEADERAFPQADPAAISIYYALALLAMLWAVGHLSAGFSWSTVGVLVVVSLAFILGHFYAKRKR